ncbi:MAG: hypothetical protein JWP92_390, partial [Caulobacter sp.]|nr:hypothetical protein [Caulobacter sp.]
MRAVLAALGTLVAVVAVVGLAMVWIYNGPGPAAQGGGKAGAVANVVLRRGASLPEIAASLETGGAIRSSSIFMTAAKLTGAARAL